MTEIFQIAIAVIGSLGGGAIIVIVCSNWLAGIWAKRMLQNERALHSEKLESIKTELELIKQKDVTRHNDKLAIYRDVVHVISETLRELEAITLGKQENLSVEVERSFALNRNKAYGYISLVSSQEVMNRYNELIDFFTPLMYEGQKSSWTEMRTKADAMLNAMRHDLGINEGDITYQGSR